MDTSDHDITPRSDASSGVQPLRDRDTSIEPDPARDPAQAEWDGVSALDRERGDEDDVPAADQPPEELQPETQGESPIEAELGEDGQGDLAPEDL